MRKTFYFKKEQLQYDIKLRRNRAWWLLLLLLLLPLLFLLRPHQTAAPCVEAVEAGVNENSYREFDMGAIRKFSISYNMYSVPDEIIVYCGRRNEKGKKLYDSRMISGEKTIPIDLSNCGSTTWVSVEIIAGTRKNPSISTEWRYKFNCPK